MAFVVRGEGGGTDAVAATALAVRSKMSRPKSGGMQSWQLKPSRRSVWADMEAVFVMSVVCTCGSVIEGPCVIAP